MIFLNPKIIRDSCDVKIGGVEYNKDKISFIQYISLVEFRLLRLVNKFVKFGMSEGMTYKQSIDDCLLLVYSTISIEDRTYPDDEEGIVDEITKSLEYKIWSGTINSRFKNIHKGVVTETYQIPVEKEAEIQEVIKDNVDLLKTEDRLDLFLEGLASVNYID